MREGLLLVGHGTRSEEGTDEFLRLAAMVAAALPGVATEPAFLELSPPVAADAVDRLVAAGARRVAVVPVMLTSAGHAKSDVPALLYEAALRHPGLALAYGRPSPAAPPRGRRRTSSRIRSQRD